MLTKKEIDDYGVIRFQSDYGHHKVSVELKGDATITEVAEAFRSFLLATGFSKSNIDDVLDIEE